MKTRYRLICRGSRGGKFYCVDTLSGKRTSLQTGSKEDARQLVAAKNQAEHQPEINLQIAKAYLAAADQNFINRTWREVMTEFVKTKSGTNRTRSERAVMDKSFDSIRDLQLIETRAEHFLRVLHSDKVSTNNYLRRFHNFALDLGWLPWPVLPKRQWPPIHYKEKRAITLEEHERILNRQKNPEIRAFLCCCWQIGGSQSDVAHLKAEDIDWKNHVISFFRAKTGTAQILHFGKGLAEVLQDLPSQGALFPYLAAMDEKHRAALFQMNCRRLGIAGISLHSYRYAWAERANVAGYPERFAMENLGHNSKAVHRSYAKRAKVKIPSLEEYEQKAA
jgi:integrase